MASDGKIFCSDLIDFDDGIPITVYHDGRPVTPPGCSVVTWERKESPEDFDLLHLMSSPVDFQFFEEVISVSEQQAGNVPNCTGVECIANPGVKDPRSQPTPGPRIPMELQVIPWYGKEDEERQGYHNKVRRPGRDARKKRQQNRRKRACKVLGSLNTNNKI